MTSGPPSFDLAEVLPLLERTPAVLRSLLAGLPEQWVSADEGDGSWSAFDVVGHLIHGEETDWIVRTEHILRHDDAIAFIPFDRDAMLRASAGRPLSGLLDEFATLRAANVARLQALGLTPADLARRGRHPELGPVTLAQLLATWVAHDLSHLGQIVRVMGKRYRDAVGPWRAYLPMLDR